MTQPRIKTSMDRLIVRLLRHGWAHERIAELLTLASQQMMLDRIKRLDQRHVERMTR